MSGMIRPGSIASYLDPPDDPEPPEVPVWDAPPAAVLRELVDLCEGRDAACYSLAGYTRGFLLNWGRRWVQLTHEEWQAHVESQRDKDPRI